MNLNSEFDRQVAILLAKEYPAAAGFSPTEFVNFVEPLRAQLTELTLPEVDLGQGILPFVIVVKSSLVPTEQAMSLVERAGQLGITKLFPHQASDFAPLVSVTIPSPEVYLLLDIDRGKANINLPPNEALKIILEQDRSPLTIDEGVAIVTQYPEFLMKNNCFSLLASRHVGDQRVPAIWINGQKQPNLGWCWDGNPHTWLGSASAKNRVG